MITPVLAKYMCPMVYDSDVCKLCECERATLTHIMWDCRISATKAAEETTLPPPLEAAKWTYDYDVQLQAVQQVSAALGLQRPSDPTEGRGSGGSLRPERGSKGAGPRVKPGRRPGRVTARMNLS